VNAPRSENAFDRNAAHPVRIRKIPRYIGFRVTLYMPEQTKLDEEFGFVGLTVVFARRNDTMPAILMLAPADTKMNAMTIRARKGSARDGVTRDPPHIARAMSSASATGGIFNSSDRMTKIIRHSVRITGGEAGRLEWRVIHYR
jgi:hypothetical protein